MKGTEVEQASLSKEPFYRGPRKACKAAEQPEGSCRADGGRRRNELHVCDA